MRVAIAVVAIVLATASHAIADPRACPTVKTVTPLHGKITQIIAGGNRTCVIDARGEAGCWGDVTACQQPTGAVRSISLAYGAVCSVTPDLVASCSGEPLTAGLASNIVALSVGIGHACAIVQGGAVRCWGFTDHGLLGYGDRRRRTMSTDDVVAIGKPAIRIAAGGSHTCVVTSEHHVRCWGVGSDGALGYGNRKAVGDDDVPASAGDVPIGADATDVVAGALHTCALLVGGRVRCWGANQNGELGYGYINTIGDDEPAGTAGDVPIGGVVTALAAGDYHTCALLDTGAVRCWGNNSAGQLGNSHRHNNIGDNEPASFGGDVELGERAIAIAAGGDHTCALLAGGGVRCWGHDER